MEEGILKSDIFFFVTTVCTVMLSITLAVAIIYGIVILNDLKYIVRKVREEGDEILKDAREVREAIKEKGGNFFSILTSFFALKRRRSRTSGHKDNKSN